MYVNNSNVSSIIYDIEKLNDLGRLKILIYIFDQVNNNQINDKNEINNGIYDDIKVFNFLTIGLSNNCCDIFVQYLVSLYNILCNKEAIYLNGNVRGIIYTSEEKKILSLFEKLNFNDKLDLISELIIRYDNETYFNDKITILTFDSKMSGYDIARNILMFKDGD